MRMCVCLVASLTLLVLPTPAAGATRTKAIWGPIEARGASVFPTYRDLGVDIFQWEVRWNEAAPVKPQKPRDPRDPAYRWDPRIDTAVAEARQSGMDVSLLLMNSPSWASGRQLPATPPRDTKAFADFAEAVSRRYRGVRYWMIWGEPSSKRRWSTLVAQSPGASRLTRRQARAPQKYARMLDSAYGRLKRLDPRDKVVGGNTFTVGDISPRNWIRAMRLPSGRGPRMDYYGHNPFTLRAPALRKRTLGNGFADISDLDTLTGWLDRSAAGRRKRLRIYASELFAPTDHPNHEFNFYVSRETAADWMTRALRIQRTWNRFFTLGTFLVDDPPDGQGTEVNRGLMDYQLRPKPAYRAFRDG